MKGRFQKEYGFVNIYALFDPISDELRYVGQTVSDIEQRLVSHVNEPYQRYKTNDAKCEWISSLLELGCVPDCRILQVVPFDARDKAERYWIGYYAAQGCRLLNLRHTANKWNAGGWQGDPERVAKRRQWITRLAQIRREKKAAQNNCTSA